MKGKRKRGLARESHDEERATAVMMTEREGRANCKWYVYLGEGTELYCTN